MDASLPHAISNSGSSRTSPGPPLAAAGGEDADDPSATTVAPDSDRATAVVASRSSKARAAVWKDCLSCWASSARPDCDRASPSLLSAPAVADAPRLSPPLPPVASLSNPRMASYTPSRSTMWYSSAVYRMANACRHAFRSKYPCCSGADSTESRKRYRRPMASRTPATASSPAASSPCTGDGASPSASDMGDSHSAGAKYDSRSHRTDGLPTAPRVDRSDSRPARRTIARRRRRSTARSSTATSIGRSRKPRTSRSTTLGRSSADAPASV
mmetsp:Transcript_20962/g.67504  ORF Transcript_20962/g.67504 Transcript_20962/m.67504 type:complete len:271 (+) Transcript_20962:3514-4326(+)